MNLNQQMLREGRWCFRWRSYLPLVTIPLFVIGCLRYQHPGGSEQTEQWWELGCVILAMLGLAMRIGVAGFAPGDTSGRNTRNMRAAQLNTTGLYSVVRHPLYVANFVIWLAELLFLYNWKILVIGSLLYWLYYERIMLAEEAVLKENFGSAFEEWSKVTPAIIPRPSRWRAPALGFSWRSAMRREYSTLLAIAASLMVLEVTTDWLLARHLTIPPGFTGLLLFSLLIYLLLRTLKKRTGLLKVAGR